MSFVLPPPAAGKLTHRLLSPVLVLVGAACLIGLAEQSAFAQATPKAVALVTSPAPNQEFTAGPYTPPGSPYTITVAEVPASAYHKVEIVGATAGQHFKIRLYTKMEVDGTKVDENSLPSSDPAIQQSAYANSTGQWEQTESTSATVRVAVGNSHTVAAWTYLYTYNYEGTNHANSIGDASASPYWSWYYPTPRPNNPVYFKVKNP